jgi:hypothetical protein
VKRKEIHRPPFVLLFTSYYKRTKYNLLRLEIYCNLKAKKLLLNTSYGTRLQMQKGSGNVLVEELQ